MIQETTTSPGIRDMTRFRARLKEKMLEKSVRLQKPLSQTEVAEQAGVSFATVQRWYKDGATFDRIDANTLYGLLDYFGCTFDELIERIENVPDEPREL